MRPSEQKLLMSNYLISLFRHAEANQSFAFVVFLMLPADTNASHSCLFLYVSLLPSSIFKIFVSRNSEPFLRRHDHAKKWLSVMGRRLPIGIQADIIRCPTTLTEITLNYSITGRPQKILNKLLVSLSKPRYLPFQNHFSLFFSHRNFLGKFLTG